MREFRVVDYVRSDMLDTGSIRAFDMRPQKITAAEPYCLKCAKRAWPTRVQGRWDSERQATAIPFDPVYVEMSCGCTFGDKSRTRP